MLYLVTPSGLERTGSVGQDLVDFARREGRDLGAIEGWWERAETPMNADHVRSALRWGLASQRGIVVAATHTVQIQRPRELEKLIRETSPRMKAYRESPEVKMVDDFLEAQMPGWKAHGEKTDAAVDASMHDSLETAIEDAADELANKDVDAYLRAHWISLGGVVPDPE